MPEYPQGVSLVDGYASSTGAGSTGAATIWNPPADTGTVEDTAKPDHGEKASDMSGKAPVRPPMLVCSLADLMAAGEPDAPRQRRNRHTLTGMVLAAAIIAATGTTAYTHSPLPKLTEGHHRPPHFSTPAPQDTTASTTPPAVSR